MTPQQYQRVKEIFLAACDKPLEQRDAYVHREVANDAEVAREVASLLKEHSRETQVMPENPESPMGSMSAILSRANIEMGNPNERAAAAVDDAARSAGDVRNPRKPAADYLDESNPSSSSNSGFVDAGRFMAGTVAAARYRIIELLGRGGMGEVYRADDLTLNQSVALKFLPALFGQDKTWLDRFHNEVRLARQVTHPNVCRVFDIGEFQGEQFLSMEYIDGENLASLLRRIGRLPHDKGLQIARQMCAGLAAAHDRGVLHRDLKPANVMIDGRGSVRITDFGLAAPADQIRKEGGGPAGLRAGTPAYMSPEQLAGRGISIRSDVYSLGLLLYEMFTGKRAFRGETLRDYQKLHTSEDPTPPSDIVPDIDPIVERVIMRCLEKDPKDRPASAMAVSAGLPGGDPLREILAAGETPSPEVVAAAGEAHRGMKPILATAFLVAGMISLLIVGILSHKAFIVQDAIQANPPVVLAHQADEILKSLGYSESPADSASGFSVNSAYYVHVQHAPRTADRAALLKRPRMGLISFWYRQSLEPLIPWKPETGVAEDDPPAESPGMLRVSLNPLGELTSLEVQPLDTSVAQTQPTLQPPNWQPLLDAAKLDESRFHSVPPSQIPSVYVDQRAAWEGSFASAPTEKLHVEAGMFRGRPAYFSISGGWKEEALSGDTATVLSMGRVNLTVQTILTLILLGGGSAMAFRHYRSGRADRLGAMRIALAFFILGFISWLLRAHHVFDLILEFRMFTRSMGSVMYSVALVWVFYLALESYVRRVWPETVISWNRLLAGRWIDPLVGRDVLIGSVIGIFIALLNILERVLPPYVGLPAPMPRINAAIQMLQSATDFSTLFTGALNAIYFGLLLLLFLVLVRMAVKKKALVAIVFVLFFVGATATSNSHDYLNWIVQSITAALFLLLMVRNGLVAMIFCGLVRMLLMDFPITFDLSVWYKSAALCGIGCTVIVLTVATYAALGGRPLVTLRIPER